MSVPGEPGSPTVLDEGTTITMALPVRGNVQVRVERVTANEAVLVTVAGHPLAGAIRFISEQRGDLIRFEVQVYDRPANLADWLMMRTMGETVQAGSWESLLQAMVEESGATSSVIEHDEEVLDEEKAERVEAWVRDLVTTRKRAQRAASQNEAGIGKGRRTPPPEESHAADQSSVF
jgi:NADH dehydrogenase